MGIDWETLSGDYSGDIYDWYNSAVEEGGEFLEKIHSYDYDEYDESEPSEPDEEDTEDTSHSNFFAEIDIKNLSKDEIFEKMMEADNEEFF